LRYTHDERTVLFVENPTACHARRNDIDVSMDVQSAVHLTAAFATDLDWGSHVNDNDGIALGRRLQDTWRINEKTNG
jgi:hypothetical protein